MKNMVKSTVKKSLELSVSNKWQVVGLMALMFLGLSALEVISHSAMSPFDYMVVIVFGLLNLKFSESESKAKA